MRIVVLMLIGLVSSCTADTQSPPQSPSAAADGPRILGRAVVSDEGEVTVSWPGSGLAGQFTGRRMSAVINDPNAAILTFEIDGEPSEAQLLQGQHEYTLFEGVAAPHTFRLTRRTGPLAAPTTIISFETDGAVTQAPPADRRMLVFGDSITAGYGVDGPDETCPYSYQTANQDHAYVSIAARELGSDLHNISFDGRGLIHNYGGGDGATMTDLANMTVAGWDVVWSPPSYLPDVIVVNLGTNDFSEGDISERFEPAYVEFLTRLRTEYPGATIFAAFGPMLHGDLHLAAASAIQHAVEDRHAAGDSKVQFIQFDWTEGAGAYGCDWHPGRTTQSAMAIQLEQAIRTGVGW